MAWMWSGGIAGWKQVSGGTAGCKQVSGVCEAGEQTEPEEPSGLPRHCLPSPSFHRILQQWEDYEWPHMYTRKGSNLRNQGAVPLLKNAFLTG